MSKNYRYKQVSHIKIGDGIMMDDGSILWVARIEVALDDPNSLIFVDGNGDEAVKMTKDTVLRLSRKTQLL